MFIIHNDWIQSILSFCKGFVLYCVRQMLILQLDPRASVFLSWGPSRNIMSLQRIFYCVWNRQSEYKVFYKLMGWLWVKLVDVLAWWGPLLRDLVHRITGQLATVVSVFLRRYLVEWGEVGCSSEFLVLYGAWYFWRGWRLAQLEYLGLRGS